MDRAVQWARDGRGCKEKVVYPGAWCGFTDLIAFISQQLEQLRRSCTHDPCGKQRRRRRRGAHSDNLHHVGGAQETGGLVRELHRQLAGRRQH